MTSKTLDYYQQELKERAKTAKWQKWEAALSTFMMLFIIFAAFVLLFRNIDFAGIKWLCETAPQSTCVATESKLFSARFDDKK